MEPQPSRAAPSLAAILRTVLTVVAVAVALYVIYLLRKPLGWIVIAGFVAVALSGPVNLFSRRMRRGFAIALTYLTAILIPLMLAAIVIVPIVNQGSQLAQNVPNYVNDIQDFVNGNKQLQDLENKYGILSNAENKAKELPARIGDAAGKLGDVGAGLVNSAFAVITILILSVFMIVYGRGWIERLIAIQPDDRRQRLDRAMNRVAAAVGNYVAGALFQATIAGVTTFIVLWLLGVPFAAPLAVMTALLDLLPLIGATIGAVIVGLVTLFNDFPTTTIIWIIWAIVYQQLENNIVQPQIQKRAVSLNPFVVIVSVLFGSTLFGVIGALFAIPVAASLQIITLEYLAYRRELAHRDDDPGPSGATGPEPVIV